MYTVKLWFHVFFLFYSNSQSGVKITAVGIGRNLNEGVLREIAGEGGNVLMVEDFDTLHEDLEKIKNISCGKCSMLPICRRKSRVRINRL